MGLFGKNKIDKNNVTILSPVDGTVKPLSKVKDEVFAGEMVGKGVAVTPTSSSVMSPADGVIKVAFDTGHAYGVEIKGVAELLVHIGVDTVSLGGEGFDMKTSQGSNVKTSSKLAEIDLELRGPGEIYGVRQSGIPDLKMASLTDFVTIEKARNAAQKVIDIDPHLDTYPMLKNRIAKTEDVFVKD